MSDETFSIVIACLYFVPAIISLILLGIDYYKTHETVTVGDLIFPPDGDAIVAYLPIVNLLFLCASIAYLIYRFICKLCEIRIKKEKDDDDLLGNYSGTSF